MRASSVGGSGNDCGSVLTNRSGSHSVNSQISSGGTRVAMLPSRTTSGSSISLSSSSQRNPVLFPQKLVEALVTVRYPDLYTDTRNEKQEAEAYDKHMDSIGASEFLVFPRSKLITLIYNDITLDADGLWSDFRQYCVEGGICNDAWLDRHSSFSFRKKNRTGSEESGSAKTLLAKFKDTANESRRDLVMLWFHIWKYRLREHIQNSMWHLNVEYFKADGNLYSCYKDCNDELIFRTNDMYDPCLQWFYPIGQKNVVLGMSEYNIDDTTGSTGITGWTCPTHVGFNGHPNYFIAPFVYLTWWMSIMQECFRSFQEMINAINLVFEMDGEEHQLQLARFDLAELFDPAFEDHDCMTSTAVHSMDYVKKVLFHLGIFYSRYKTQLLAFGDRFLEVMHKCDWCLRSIRDYRHRAEIHQFFGFFKGLGANGDFFFKVFVAWKWTQNAEGVPSRTEIFTIRDPSDLDKFFTWQTFSYYAKVSR